MGIDETLSKLWHLRGNVDEVSFEELKKDASDTSFMAISTIKYLLWEIEQKDKLINELEKYIKLRSQ